MNVNDWTSLHQMYLFVAVRIRLRWMMITGTNVSSVNEVELYRDDGSTESCGPYAKGDTSVNIGTSPCDDILLIPVSNTHLFRYVKISVPDYLNLCEVLVYAGKIGCLNWLAKPETLVAGEQYIHRVFVRRCDPNQTIWQYVSMKLYSSIWIGICIKLLATQSKVNVLHFS